MEEGWSVRPAIVEGRSSPRANESYACGKDSSAQEALPPEAVQQGIRLPASLLINSDYSCYCSLLNMTQVLGDPLEAVTK